MEDAALAAQGIGDMLQLASLAADDNHLGAPMMIQVHMSAG